VNEIRGAIERINNPDVLAQPRIAFNGSALRVNMARLFAEHGVAGKGPEKRFNNCVLGGPIDLGYKVVGLFSGNANGVDIKRRTGDDSTGTTRRPNAHIDHRMHDVIVEECLTRIRVVLVEPSHPGNIGSVARAMKTMGLTRLVVVAPREPGFARVPEAVAFASGAHDLMEAAVVVDTLEQALAGTVLQMATASMPREFAAQPLDPDTASLQMLDQLRLAADPVALVFGTERVGLSMAQAQLCSHFASIPTALGCDSLNLAQAVQVFAWSLRRAALQAVDSDAQPSSLVRRAQPTGRSDSDYATHDQVEGLYAHLESALIAIGFLDPAEPKRLMPRLRNLFGRTRLQRQEVDILRGVCTRMVSISKPTSTGPGG
jgi:tRNA/rRNA methyltransferase